MKIAIVALHFAEYASRLAQALAARGDNVLLILEAQNATSELGKRGLVAPARVRTVFMRDRALKDPRVVMNALSLRRLLREFAPDVVHIQETLQDYLVFAVLGLRQLAPLVLTVHDHVSHSGQDSRISFRRRMYRQYLRRSADALILHGQVIAEEIQCLDPSLRQRVWSIPHGVLGLPPTKDLSPEPGNVLFFGRIEAYKGLGVLIDAIAKLQHAGVKVSLTVAGRGTDLERHRTAIKHMLGGRLNECFIPAEEVPAIFQRANIVALPYLDATQSGVAALAATYGRPVVASRTGGLPEMVREGVSGLLVEPGDSDQLANAIRTLVEQPDLAANLAAGARQLARTDLSWEAIAERTVEVYVQARGRRQHQTVQGSMA